MCDDALVSIAGLPVGDRERFPVASLRRRQDNRNSVKHAGFDCMNQEMTLRSQHVEALLARLQAGDLSARDELLQATCDRFTYMARAMKRDFPKVGRWEQTEDIVQNASLRLYRALEDVEIADARHFFRLVALQIRRELIDMARHYEGAHGLGHHHQTQRPVRSEDSSGGSDRFEAAEVTNDPHAVAVWSELHETIEQLPDDQREVTELLWYHGMTQQDAADLLKVDVRTIKRRWRSARIYLHDKLHGELPSI